MHNLNVLILGPSSFISTLIELKIFLKFNPLSNNLNDNHKIIFFHVDALKDVNYKKFIKKDCIKICEEKRKIANFDAYLQLPTTLKEIIL